MSSVIRLSRFGKIATLTAASGGSLYIFRDIFKHFFNDQTQPILEDSSKSDHRRLIENLPEHVSYLLVGGGTASHSAMRSIRGQDPKAKVLIVGGENHLPYMRPALSKELWFTESELRRELKFKWWNGKEKSIFYEIDEFFLPLNKLNERENGGVSLLKNIRLTRLDPEDHVAHLENGQSIKYDKCLLATGGKPKTLPQLDAAPEEVKKRIVYFRTADDFLRLEEVARNLKRIVIIGGGFLGSELTCALANRKAQEQTPISQEIIQIYPESGNLGKILPQYLSEYVSKKIEAEGAKLIPNAELKSVSMAFDKSIKIELSSGQTIEADCIICAVGLEPDVDLAKSSGLEVDEKIGGYLVNSELEARSNVWVAGDASCFYDMKLGRRRVEHHDHAVNSGKLAGLNMVGAGKPYTHQSMFWSDLGRDISFEAVGIIDSSLRTVSVFADQMELERLEVAKSGTGHNDQDRDGSLPEADSQGTKSDDINKYGKGVIFYLKDDIIVGILLWNLFSRLTVARRVLNEQRRYDDLNEVAKMFNLYLDD